VSGHRCAEKRSARERVDVLIKERKKVARRRKKGPRVRRENREEIIESCNDMLSPRAADEEGISTSNKRGRGAKE